MQLKRLIHPVLLAALAAPSLVLAQTPPAPASPPPGPGLDLINQRCVSCHPVSTIFTQRKTPSDWAATIQLMADRGAEVSPDEMTVIAEYLSKNYGAPAAGSTAAPAATAGAGPSRR